MKRIGEEWKMLSPVEKRFYEDKARDDKERFIQEVSQLSPDQQTIIMPPKKPERPKGGKGHNGKRALSPYLLFVKDVIVCDCYDAIGKT